ncbi:MAG: hypothetical protein KBD83_03060 [Gammaproteobacteria bacterium]|nr:hypothetical protein [Gammaproteobacteria bacterium]
MFTDSPFAAEAESKAAEAASKAAQVKTTLAVDTTVNDAMQAKAESGNTPVSPTPVSPTPSEAKSVDGSGFNGPHGRSLRTPGFYSSQKTDSTQSTNDGKQFSPHV